MERFKIFVGKVSRNHSRTVWVLKCDIRKFFASIDQGILLALLDERIADKRIVGLLSAVVQSFDSGVMGVGLPLGNLTSQLLANVYMNEFDQFVKHRLRVGFYVRYADDFVFLHEEKQMLEVWLPLIAEFLWERLRLRLHPDKVFITTLASGVDFLGWVHFPNHRVLRGVTRDRMLRNMNGLGSEVKVAARRASYLEMCSHGNTWKLRGKL